MPATRLRARPEAVEWPTVAVAACIYAGFAATTWWYHQLPAALVAAAGGYLLAWQGSLQHEVIHGHPTRWRWLNELLVFPALTLWLPFALYRNSHLVHHRVEQLTDPATDPESWYLSAERWRRTGAAGRAGLWLLNTSLGRVTLGPLVMLVRFAAHQARALRRGRLDTGAWLLHCAAAAPVLFWVVGVCGIPLVHYLALFVYPYLALTLMRTFPEHQAEGPVSQRTSAVETNPALALLYLNNNLHVLHHERPWLAWYRLPRVWRAERDRILRDNGGWCYRGYLQVMWRYAVRARSTPCWPLAAVPREAPGELPAPVARP